MPTVRFYERKVDCGDDFTLLQAWQAASTVPKSGPDMSRVDASCQRSNAAFLTEIRDPYLEGTEIAPLGADRRCQRAYGRRPEGARGIQVRQGDYQAKQQVQTMAKTMAKGNGDEAMAWENADF